MLQIRKEKEETKQELERSEALEGEKNEQIEGFTKDLEEARRQEAAQTAVLNEKELDVEKSGSSSDFIRQTKTVSPEKSHDMRASWKRSKRA